MATITAIDDGLINEAMLIGRHSTKEEAVTAALTEYIRRRKQMKILDLFGTVDFDAGYCYKENRKLDRRV